MKSIKKLTQDNIHNYHIHHLDSLSNVYFSFNFSYHNIKILNTNIDNNMINSFRFKINFKTQKMSHRLNRQWETCVDFSKATSVVLVFLALDEDTGYLLASPNHFIHHIYKNPYLCFKINVFK